ELIAVGLGVYWSSAYLAMRGRHPLWGVLFVLMPGALTSFDRMLADGLLTALFVGFLYYTETQAWNKAYAVTVLAGLTRETGLIVCIPLALRWISQNPLSPGGLTIVLFAGLALILGSPRHLTESYGYSRPVSPLLAFVTLQAIACGAWTALAFPFFVCLSVGLR